MTWPVIGPLPPLDDGTRGTGANAGTPVLAMFKPGAYPACTKHGAMNALGNDIWRCLAFGCNVGTRYQR